MNELTPKRPKTRQVYGLGKEKRIALKKFLKEKKRINHINSVQLKTWSEAIRRIYKRKERIKAFNKRAYKPKQNRHSLKSIAAKMQEQGHKISVAGLYQIEQVLKENDLQKAKNKADKIKPNKHEPKKRKQIEKPAKLSTKEILERAAQEAKNQINKKKVPEPKKEIRSTPAIRLAVLIEKHPLASIRDLWGMLGKEFTQEELRQLDIKTGEGTLNGIEAVEKRVRDARAGKIHFR